METGNSGLNKYPFHLLTEYFLSGNHITPDQEYEIFSIPAKELLHSNRLDLMAKWIYIDAREKRMNIETAKELYVRHIEAFSMGTYMEPGSREKDSVSKYLEVFEALIQEFKKNEFDETISLIPIGKNNILLDGSHRCACAAYYDKNVTVIKFPKLERNYNYNFFRKRFLSAIHLDRMVLEYCQTHKNIYFACFWPVAEDDVLQEKAMEMLSNCGSIIYEKRLCLEYNAVFNFMIQIYGHQEWTGSYANNHEGVKSKADHCFAKGKRMRIVIFEGSVFEKVLEIKGQIRLLFGIGNHAIHISDNDNETRLMADLLLNENSLHHLKYGHPDKDKHFNQLFLHYIGRNSNNSGKGRYIIAADSVMAIYGIGESEDLHFLTLDQDYSQIFGDCKGIDNYENQLKYYKLSKEDMLYNPKNYFVYNGVKFLTLDVIKEMKIKRNEEKDKKDIQLINKFVKRNPLSDILKWENFINKLTEYKRKHHIYGKDDTFLGKIRKAFYAFGGRIKSARKNTLEKMLGDRFLGAVILKTTYPIARILNRTEGWKRYQEYWMLQIKRHFNLLKQSKLSTSNFTILSNNCVGGVILHDLNLKFNTPTINLWFPNPLDFIRYVNNLQVYSKCELIEKHTDKKYPVGELLSNLGNIELHFMHYSSFEEAKDKWQERTKRINYDNLYIIMELGKKTTLELLNEFNKIPQKNKVAITDKPYEDFPVFNLSIYDDKYYSGKTLSYQDNSYKRYIDEFDYVEFLNCGKIQRV